MNNHVKNYWCRDLYPFIDSMLFDSGTQIAELMYADGEWEICISLEVAGSVNVDYKGNRYRYPSDFPQELKNRIINNGLFDDEDLYVDMNNWFEYVYDVIQSPSNKKYSDGVVCEWDISKGTSDDILNQMLDIISWVKGEK